MLQKTMERFVLPALASSAIVVLTFYLWMSPTGVDTLCLVVNLIDSDWEPGHIIVGIFKASNIARAILAVIVKMLLSDFHLIDKVISYVKGEGSNLKTLALALTSVVSCKPLALLQPYPGVYFGHIMSKACQNFTDDTKVCIGIKKMSIKEA